MIEVYQSDNSDQKCDKVVFQGLKFDMSDANNAPRLMFVDIDEQAIEKGKALIDHIGVLK